MILLPPTLKSQTDNALLRIPIDQYERASQCVISGLRVYHRLPGFLLVGDVFHDEYQMVCRARQI